MLFGQYLLIFVYIASVYIFHILLEHILVFTEWLYIFKDHAINKEIFDYIVVGAGSAGSIIANRLSRNSKNSVLLLEAGKDVADLLHIPSMGLLLQQTSYDWAYKTEPQNYACGALNNNVSLWPMGNILGGTSMLNNMLYVRGHKEDFNEWFKDNKEYDSSDILKYFKNLENFSEKLHDENTDTSKPIYVRDLIFSSSLQNIILKAASAKGHNISKSGLNCDLGFSKPKANLFNGQRWTSANYIKKHPRRNLFVQTSCLVEKVLLKSNFEARGVLYTRFGMEYVALARKGVILTAGVIGSPKILMLSGIGPKDHLASLGISSIANLPVGNNLQDHLTTGFDLILLNHTLNIGIQSMISVSSAFQYFSEGNGPWTTTGCELMAFFNTKQNLSEPPYDRPDLQFMVMPLGITEDKGYYLRKLVGISDQTWTSYFSKINKTSLTILPVLLHPKSKGFVRLRGTDPSLPPVIDPRYLSDPADVKVLLSGIELIKTLLKTEELRSFGADLNTNVYPGCEEYEFDSTSYWECYISYLTFSAYHPIGTCKMGSFNDPTSVVDFNFKVKGINKLYVADGSVLPTLPSGNVNGPILMIAEMAAELISRDFYLNSKSCSNLEVFIPINKC